MNRCYLSRLVLAGLFASLAAGCGNQEQVAESKLQDAGPEGLIDPALVVAETRLGAITAADLDQYVLNLAPGRRPEATAERDEWFVAVARRVAIDRLLLDEAVLVGADKDPQFRVLERRIERNAFSNHYLAGLPPPAPITREELEAAYDEKIETYQREEKRLAFHIYKRFGADISREQAVAELVGLRERVLAGESFEILAREHSDSETRHNGGLIGELGRGQFTEDFDRVVFELAQRVPSEPVTTQDGAHLFWVQSIVEARKFDFEDVRTSILEEMMSQRRVDQLQEAAAALPQPEPRLVPSREEALQLLRLGDPATVVLRLGDFSLTVAQLQEILQTERRMLGAKQVADLPFQILYEVRDREVIYQHQTAGDEDGTGRDSVPEEQFRRARDKELVQYYARRKMISWIERRADLVREQYENNRMRFASRLRVGLRWLVIPTGEDGPAVMAQLEAAKPDLDRGTLQLEDLARSYGGEVKDLGVVSAAQVQSFAPRAMRFVFLLKPGEHSPPYTSAESLVMFQVTERQDPQPQALALVRDEVVQDYLTHHAPEIFQELTDEMLQAADFRVYHERLVGFGPVAPTLPGRP